MAKQNSKKKASNSAPKAKMPMMPFIPVLPVMPIMPNGNNMGWFGMDQVEKENMPKAEDIVENIKSFWEQNIEMQKSSRATAKDQWAKMFEYFMDMEDNFASSVPDLNALFPELPISVSVKDIVKRLQEFQKMANEHFVAQADSVSDFCIKGQKQAVDAVAAAADTIKKAKEEAEEKAEDKAEEKAAEAEEKPAEAEAKAEKKASEKK